MKLPMTKIEFKEILALPKTDMFLIFLHKAIFQAGLPASINFL